MLLLVDNLTVTILIESELICKFPPSVFSHLPSILSTAKIFIIFHTISLGKKKKKICFPWQVSLLHMPHSVASLKGYQGLFSHLLCNYYNYACKIYLIYYMWSSLRVQCMCNLTTASKYKDCIMQMATLIMKEHLPSGAASGKSFIFQYFQITYCQAEKNSLTVFDCCWWTRI